MTETLGKPLFEQKIANLIDNVKDSANSPQLEASGVVFLDNHYLIVFDEMHGIAKIPRSKKNGFKTGSLIGSQRMQEGFEAITYDSRAGCLYALVENSPYRHGLYRPSIQQFTLELLPAGKPRQLPLSLPLDNINTNKGLEGAAIIHRNSRTFLFGLCEGKNCNSDDSKDAPGQGMIQIFEKNNNDWKVYGAIKLPIEVNFRDFSDISVQHNRIAVVSQKSAKIWLGLLHEDKDTWTLTHLNTYRFPTRKNKIEYCNVEGIDWIAENQLVLVSDMASKKRCKPKEMMIHIFEIPR